ncbi:uncharacterized protein LOC129753658 [Uranotaenia lowii]|uniref:uncharacterized protein LOC129753658 n=1 Tax=Uranotaenia lowii TaxID=190385 RepID=UPI0024792C9B|nr:uncharacterized protein LOC129753658 [Uranotaenia lowii]
MAFTDIVIVGAAAIEKLLKDFNVVDIDSVDRSLKYTGVTIKLANGGRKVATILARDPEWGSPSKGPFKYYGDRIWLNEINAVLTGQRAPVRAVPKWCKSTIGCVDHPSYIESLAMACCFNTVKQTPGRKSLIDNGILDINQLLAYIIWIPGLESVHRQYYCNPDEGIETKTRAETDEDKAYCSSRMLLCTKNIAGDSHDILDSLLTKRFQAISSVMNAPATQIKDFKDVFAYEDLLQLQRITSHYPNFRSCMFRTLLISRHPIAQHMSEIFETSSMTQFKIIYEFVTAPNLTLLHIDLQVVGALCKWWEVAKELIDTYDDMWTCYELICPASTKTAIGPFRTAAIAAMSWKRATNNAESLGQIKGVKTEERYIRLAQKVLPPRCYEGIDFTGGWLDKAKETSVPMISWEKLNELIDSGDITLE